MTTRYFDPAKDKDACQGDIYIFPLPAKYKVSRAMEIKPSDGRLTLLEGEASGHFHAILPPQPLMFRDDAIARTASDAQTTTGTAHLYKDDDLIRALVGDGELTTDALVLGFLVVEVAPIALKHVGRDGNLTGEHDDIVLPVGRYYVGRQREWNLGEESNVND